MNGNAAQPQRYDRLYRWHFLDKCGAKGIKPGLKRCLALRALFVIEANTTAMELQLELLFKAFEGPAQTFASDEYIAGRLWLTGFEVDGHRISLVQILFCNFHCDN